MVYSCVVMCFKVICVSVGISVAVGVGLVLKGGGKERGSGIQAQTLVVKTN